MFFLEKKKVFSRTEGGVCFFFAFRF